MPALIYPLTDLLPPERFKSWSVMAPFSISFDESTILVEWREDALGNPIQHLRLLIGLACCYEDTEFGSGIGLQLFLQTFVRKKGSRWFPRNFSNALKKDDDYAFVNFEICEAPPETEGCEPPNTPGRIYFSDFEAQIDQWLIQSEIVSGSKTDLFVFEPDFLGCDPLDEFTCFERDSGWYYQVFIDRDDLFDPIFLIPPTGIPNEGNNHSQIIIQYQDDIIEDLVSLIPLLEDKEYNFGATQNNVTSIYFQELDLYIDIRSFFCDSDPKCPFGGWGMEHFDFSGNPIGFTFLKVENIPEEPDYGEICDFTYSNQQLIYNAMYAKYQPSGERYIDWDFYISCPISYYDRYDTYESAMSQVYACITPCPPGTTYDPKTLTCVKKCPVGTALDSDGNCTPIPEIEFDEDIQYFVRCDYVYIPGNQDYDTIHSLDDVNGDGTLECTTSNSNSLSPPQYSYHIEPYDITQSYTSQVQVFHNSESSQGSLPENGFDGCGWFGNYGSSTITYIGISLNGYGIDCAPEFSSYVRDQTLTAWGESNQYQTTGYTISINGKIIQSYASPGGSTPPTINNDNPGPCTFCMTAKLTISFVIPRMMITRRLPDGSKRVVYDGQEFQLPGTIEVPLPTFCTNVPAGLDPLAIQVLASVAEQGLSLAIDLAVDSVVTATFPGFGAVFSKFVSFGVDFDVEYKCP